MLKGLAKAAVSGAIFFACAAVFAQQPRVLNPAAPSGSSQSRMMPEPANWVVRIVWDERGEPVAVEHKWPFGSPDNIKTIRVPWGYRHLIFGSSPGAQLTNNGHRPSLEQGYGGFFFWALLPGVTPHDARNPPVVDRTMEFDLLTAKVDPLVNKAYPVWDAHGWLRRLDRILVDALNRGPIYRDVPKVALEPRFGLNRIGPAWVVHQPMEAFSPPPHNDLWFDGPDPSTSGTFIMCGSDYRRDGTRDPDDFPRSLCEHWFAHDGMTASVTLTYWKKHLANWRDIERQAAELLDSFKKLR